MLTASSLSIGYQHPLASDLNLELRPAELACLIGPNGVGKSTLLRTLAGMEKPLTGTIWLGSEILNRLTPLELAKRLAIVLTARVESPLLTGGELVALGRHPYTDWLGRLAPRDKQAVQRAMQLTDTLRFSARPLAQLSDGERQKVMIARALAQEPKILLLDEPTAFLDLPRRVELLQLLRRLAHETGTAILLSTHDLDLALRLADRLWLLSSSGSMEVGLPEELALNGAVARVFESEGAHFDHAIGAFRVHQAVHGPISLEGNGFGVTNAWTWRALERLGYEVHHQNSHHSLRVEILSPSCWRLVTASGSSEHPSLESLIQHLPITHTHENLLRPPG